MDGRIAPTGTFHISRAYGAQPPMRVRPVEGPPTIAKLEPQQPSLSKLVAGVVKGKIDFTGDAPAHDASALAMYHHPADKNAAATAVNAGRMLDVTG